MTISIRLFSAETTGPIFTKILNDIVALVTLFNHAYTGHYPIPFLSQSDESAEFAIFCTKSVAMATSLEISKRGPDRLSAPKMLSFGERIAKIGPADPEIICLQEIIKKDAEEDKKERN